MALIQLEQESDLSVRARVQDKGLKFLQINLHGSSAANDLVNYSMAADGINVGLLQDYHANKQYHPTGLSKRWQVIHTQSNRAAIVTNTGTNPRVLHRGTYTTAITLENDENSLNIVNTYAPPSANFDEVMTELDEVLKKAQGKTLLAGDFNAHSTLWGYDKIDYKGRQLMDLLATNQLYICNAPGAPPSFKTPRSQGWPDITAATHSLLEEVSNWQVTDETTLSDHQYIKYTLCTTNKLYSRHRLETKHGKHKHFDKEVKRIANTQMTALQRVHTKDEFDEFTEMLQDQLKQLAQKCYKRRQKPQSIKPIWFTDQLKIQRNKVRAYRRRFQKEQDETLKPALRTAYQRERALFKRAIKDAKARAWQNFCNNASDPYGRQYKILRNKQHAPSVIEKIEIPSNATPSLSDIQGYFLDSLFLTRHNIPHNTHPTHPPCHPDHWVSKEELDRILRCIKQNKAPGHDQIDYNLLKRIYRATPSFLLAFLNKALQLNHFPRSLKNAIVVLFHKAGKPTNNPKSYRPICLLPVLGKILERIIHGRISHHLHRRGLSNPNQFGFKQGVSTEHALNNAFQHIQLHKQKGFQTMLVSFDISGAFDSIRWPSIITQLTTKCTPPYLTNIIRSFLSQRSVTLEENGIVTDRRQYGGCPQGSCLGPLLWNVIADRVLNDTWPSHTRIQAFADDFLLIIRGKDAETLVQNTNEAIKKFSLWANSEHLQINWQKTQLLYLNRPKLRNLNAQVGITLEGIHHNNTPLHPQSTLKYLGLTLHKNLKWVAHLTSIRQKIHSSFRALGSISNRQWGIKPSLIKVWYKTVVERILLYAAPIWGTSLCTRSREIISSCQRIYALACTKAYRTAPTSALLVLAGLTPAHIQAKYEAVYGRVARLRQPTRAFGTTFLPAEYEEKIQIWATHPAEFRYPKRGINNHGIHIFTDGSQLESGTGAAFVAFKNSKIIFSWQAPLRIDNSVFQAELLAIKEALTWGYTMDTDFTIHSDCLSAIHKIEQPFNTDRIAHEITKLLYNNRANVKINWVKAHVGIIGNEAADREAKKAASNTQHLPVTYLRKPISKLKHTLKDKAHREWQQEWDNNTKTGRVTHSYFNKVTTERLISCSKLTQVYTEHGAFPAYLYRFKRARSPNCPCGDEGTCLHYLTACPLTAAEGKHIKAPTDIQRWKEKLSRSPYYHSKLQDVIEWLTMTIDELIDPIP